MPSKLFIQLPANPINFTLGLTVDRLEWSLYSSPLSRHYQNKCGECVGIDPTTDRGIARLAETAQSAKAGDPRIFTIIDSSPIGVSYEWETATCYCDNVMRMDTPMMEKVPSVSKVLFGLGRKTLPIKRAS